MEDQDNANTFSIAELRKKYPNIGLRWSSEEDERLKERYEQFRAEGGDFELLLCKLVERFGRAPGGIKARLAKYFPDVPGHDYVRDKHREEERAQAEAAQFSGGKDEVLLLEYYKYRDSRKETFRNFARRMVERLGVARSFIKPRIEKLTGPVVEYFEDDIDRYGSAKAGRLKPGIPQVDYTNNPEAVEALRLMKETGGNLFLTGEAGTGKSTLLQYFRRTSEKNVVVLAPTGVAALNVEGQTIHSFCGFGPHITIQKVKRLQSSSPKRKLLEKLHTIVIDEISMVRADLLDCVDRFLRMNGPTSQAPFGGIQMIFIGDLYQLPPVEKDLGVHEADRLFGSYRSPYFFDARSFRESSFRFIQLRQKYRQKDEVFLEVLNAIRNNAATSEHLAILNQRTQSPSNTFTFEKFAMYLTTTNQRARQVNSFLLEKLKAPLKAYSGIALGSFEDRELPTDRELRVKVGAQVMMLTNDPRRRWVNGTMGKIVDIIASSASSRANPSAPEDESRDLLKNSTRELTYESFAGFEGGTRGDSSDIIAIELETGETVNVSPHTWEMFQFVYNAREQKVDTKTTGTFTQYPFKLAWAVTIHKSQGKTFDKVYVDLATGTFAHGQLYVALSRCRTLEGLVLKRPVEPRDIMLDQRVVEFFRSLIGEVNGKVD